jgi:hypothetical protein
MADDTQTDDTKTGPDKDARYKSFMQSVQLPTGSEVQAKEQKLFEEHKVARQPFLDKDKELTEKMNALNEEMANIKPPEKPKQEKLPDAPDTKMQDPIKAMGSVGSLIAILGSLKTRAPMTSALNAAAASMKAYHQGDMEAAQLEREKWKDNFEKALKSNQEEMQQYTAALQESQFDITRAQSKLRTIAAQQQNNSMLAAIENGDYQAQEKILSGGIAAGEKGATLYTQWQEKNAQIAATAQAHADSLADRKAARQAKMDDKQKAADDKVASMVDGIDQAVAMIDAHPEVVGGFGKVRRGAEWLGNVTGVSDDTSANDFQAVMTQLQNDYKKSPYGGAATKFKADAAKVDNVVAGLGNFESPQAAKSALLGLRNHIQGLAYKDAGVEPPSAGGMPSGAPTATNPKTGQKIYWDGSAWQPIQQ